MPRIKKSHSLLGNRASFIRPARLATGLLVAVLTQCTVQSLLRAEAQAPVVSCGTGREIQLTIDTSWEEVPVNNAAVLCAFRSKNVGFPTLTVIKTPPQPAYELRSAESKRTQLEQSYRSVGMSDARVEQLHEGTRDGVPLTDATILFTSKQTPMTALVRVFELPDRSYVVTLQDHAPAFEKSRGALFSIIDSVMLASKAPSASARETKGSLSPGVGIFILVIAVLLALAQWLRLRKRRTRSP